MSEPQNIIDFKSKNAIWWLFWPILLLVSLVYMVFSMDFDTTTLILTEFFTYLMSFPVVEYLQSVWVEFMKT